MSRTLDLRGSTTKLVIDHHTVHHAANTCSVHVLEKRVDGEGKDAVETTSGGFDLDGVTVDELGSTGEIAAAISGQRLVSFVRTLAPGKTVVLDEAPPAPVAE